MFMWRLLSNALPTLENLNRRGIWVAGICLICKSKEESMKHLFCFCPWVQRTWFGSIFSFNFNSETQFDINQWLHSCLTEWNLTEWEKALVAMTLWHIWKGRNLFIYERCEPNPIFTFSQAGVLLKELWDVKGWSLEMTNKCPNHQLFRMPREWKRLSGNGLKINSDCALAKEEGKASIAFVIRDSNGWLLDGCTKPIDAESVLMAESKAIYEALLFAVSNELEDVTFESDNLVLIKMISKEISSPDWKCDILLENILALRNLGRNFSFDYVPREANLVVDWVAKASIRGSCPYDWTIRPPEQLQQLLRSDVGREEMDPG